MPSVSLVFAVTPGDTAGNVVSAEVTAPLFASEQTAPDTHDIKLNSISI